MFIEFSQKTDDVYENLQIYEYGMNMVYTNMVKHELPGKSLKTRV